ncbi:hypothetical protein ACFL5X_03395 [Candidatus Omnitrophota bacterium]
MKRGPLERNYGRYRLTLRKSDHLNVRPTPHVEIWKGSRKIGNYDMATSRALFKKDVNTPNSIKEAITDYLSDPQVVQKVENMIEESYFDLSKPAGEYGGIPRGFKVTITVEYTKESLNKKYR